MLAYPLTVENCCEVILNHASSRPNRYDISFPANHCTIWFIDVCVPSIAEREQVKGGTETGWNENLHIVVPSKKELSITHVVYKYWPLYML